MWTVNRHGGRASDTWRTLLETEDEQQARDRYQKEYVKLRQGGIELRDSEGERVAKAWSPRLRSRW